MSKLVTADVIAEKLGVPVSWVMSRTRSRCPEAERIPCRRLGHYVRFLESEVDEWIAEGCRLENPRSRTLKAVNQK
jgi:predicted DNA-binding transcriptional regulator AlpA